METYISVKKLIALIPTNQKIESIYIIILTFLSAFVELISIGIFIPVFSFLTNIELRTEYSFVFNVLNSFSPSNFLNISINEEIEFIFSSSVVILLIFIFKFFFISFFNWSQLKFTGKIEVNLSSNLFKKYLKSDYNFFLKYNSATIIRNIHVLCPQIASTTYNLLIIFSEFLILISIISLIIFFDYFVLIILIFFSLSFLIYFFFVKAKLHNWGYKRNKYDEEKLKHLNQGIGSIKEIKLSNNENFFSNLFYNAKSNEVILGIYLSFINNIPRLLFEGLAILALVTIVAFFIYQNKSINEIIPLLGLLITSSYRVAPSLNRMLSSLQALRFSNASINTIYFEFLVREKNQMENKNYITLNKNFTMSNIDFKYENNSNNTLNKINITIDKNLTYLIIGNSGSGKSTFVNILTDILKPSKGEIRIDDEIKLDTNKLKFGYVSQDVYLIDAGIAENIALGINKENINTKKIEKLISEVKLDDLYEDLNKNLYQPLGDRGTRISGGQKQRIAIARALYNDPELLIFDESTNSLDLKTEEKIIKLINSFKNKKTVFIISHQINSNLKFDKIIKIENRTALLL